jgi:hypothetical protein
MVYTYRWVHDVVDDNGDVSMKLSYWGNCPICDAPLEEVYYGGGVTKHECNNCVKNFVTSISSEYDD